MGGIQSVRKVGFHELRDSIPGAFVPEQDFELFYSKCKIETARTMTNVLYPSPTQLFFVVISGEVHVQLSSPDVKNKVITAATYTAGEVIHFFNAPTECINTSNFDFNEFGDCIRNADVKLALHFNHNHKHTGRVIGIDQRAYEDFMVSANGNLHNLTSFLGLNIANIVRKTHFFKATTPEQAHMYGLLLKVQLSFPGKVIDLQGRTPRSTRNPDTPDPPDSTPSPMGCTATFMHGNGLSVPLSTNLVSLCNRIKEENRGSSSGVSRKNQKGLTGFTFRAPAQLPRGPGISEIVDLPDLNKPIPTMERENSNRGKKLVAVQEGASIGTDSFYTHKTGVNIRAYVTTTSSVLGYIAHESLDALFEADPRFKRVFSRNYFSLLLSWVKFNVPFIMDMDEWSVALLSCKISLRGCETDSVVKRKGDPSNYAYIVLGGSCKELPDNSLEADTGTDRVISWGGMLGEVALTTNTPYFHTVVAREPTLLLVLGKRVLDQIYYNNKAKLCEIRIRMMGVDVDLLHAIDHPTGIQLFNEYLARQHAQENLAFYTAVDRYDATCKSVQKLYTQILKMRARALQIEFLGSNTTTAGTNDAESIEGSLDSSNHYISQIQDLISSKSRKLPQSSSGNSVSIKNMINNANATSGTASTEMDAQKQFAIKVKPASTNTINNVYHSNKIIIHEHDSDEEHGVDHNVVSIRRSIAERDNKDANMHNSSAHSLHNSSTNSLHYSASIMSSNMYVDTSSSTIGINTSGISGISSNISGGISNVSTNTMTNTSVGNMNTSSKKFNMNNINTSTPYTPGTNIDNTTPTQSGSSTGAYAITPNSANNASSTKHNNTLPPHAHSRSGSSAQLQDVSCHSGEDLVMTTVSTDSVLHESSKQEGTYHTHTDLVNTTNNTTYNTTNNTANNSATNTASNNTIAIDNTDQGTDSANPDSPTGRRRHHKSSFLKSKNDTLESALQYSENILRYTEQGAAGGNVGNVGGLSGVGSSSMYNSVGGSVLNSVGGVYGGDDGSKDSAEQRNNTNNTNTNNTNINRDSNTIHEDSVPDNQLYPPGANAITNTNNTNSNSAESTLDLHQRIHRSTHKLTKQITELKAVAYHIMNTYVVEGADSQLNLPGLMRMRAEKCFSAWSSNASSKAHKIELMVPGLKSRSHSFELLDGEVAESIVSALDLNMTGAGGAGVSSVTASGRNVYDKVAHGMHNVDATTPPAAALPSALRRQPSSINSKAGSTNTGSVNEEYHHSTEPSNNNNSSNVAEAATDPATASALEPEEAALALIQRLGLSSSNIHNSADSAGAADTVPATVSKNSLITPYNNTDTTIPLERSVFVGAPHPINTNQPYVQNALRKLNSLSSGGEFSPASYQYLNRTTSLDTSAPIIPVEGIDMSFVDLFREVKQEILKLLRDDKFPRWKNTAEFHTFISSIKPYDRDREHTRTLHSSVEQNSSDKDRSVNSQSTRSKNH